MKCKLTGATSLKYSQPHNGACQNRFYPLYLQTDTLCAAARRHTLVARAAVCILHGPNLKRNGSVVGGICT